MPYEGSCPLATLLLRLLLHSFTCTCQSVALPIFINTCEGYCSQQRIPRASSWGWRRTNWDYELTNWDYIHWMWWWKTWITAATDVYSITGIHFWPIKITKTPSKLLQWLFKFTKIRFRTFICGGAHQQQTTTTRTLLSMKRSSNCESLTLRSQLFAHPQSSLLYSPDWAWSCFLRTFLVSYGRNFGTGVPKCYFKSVLQNYHWGKYIFFLKVDSILGIMLSFLLPFIEAILLLTSVRMSRRCVL